jgi:ribose-phosphate pyrophosphokinase
MTATVLRIVVGSANPGLAVAVANHLGVDSDGCLLERYPDGELRPTVETSVVPMSMSFNRHHHP